MVDVSRRGRGPPPRRSARSAPQRFHPEGGDLDLDASLEALAEARASGRPPDVERLRLREWRRPATALCLSSIAADRWAAARSPPRPWPPRPSPAGRRVDYSVLAFGHDVVVAKAQDHPKPPDRVVTDVLALRGFGTTDLAAALREAGAQLQRSPAGRRIAVLLSDCRATVPGDVVSVARALDELCIVAPASDAHEAAELAVSVGARLATVDGPSQIPAALAAVLGD